MANMVKKQPKRLNKGDKKKLVLTVVFAFIALFYLMPIFLVLINSFKANAYVNTETFAMPNEKSFVGLCKLYQGHDLRQLSLYQIRVLQLAHNHRFDGAYPAVHLDGGVVHLPRGDAFQQDSVLPLRVLHDRTHSRWSCLTLAKAADTL